MSIPSVIRYLIILAVTLVTGCASVTSNKSAKLQFNDSLSSTAQRSRVELIVLHYTASNSISSKLTLTQKDVSAHYLVTDDDPPIVYRIVPESQSAWHAGDSSWYGRTYLNSSSIGIEVVHPGWVRNTNGNAGIPYPREQINVVTKLVQDIAARHKVPPENIVGHSDIAPSRKQDPGPAFPWKELAQSGLGRWFDENKAIQLEGEFKKKGVPDTKWFQAQLKRVGYNVPENGQLDSSTKAVIAAFQQHYRPSQVSGLPDAETAARLSALPTTGTNFR